MMDFSFIGSCELILKARWFGNQQQNREDRTAKTKNDDPRENQEDYFIPKHSITDFLDLPVDFFGHGFNPLIKEFFSEVKRNKRKYNQSRSHIKQSFRG